MSYRDLTKCSVVGIGKRIKYNCFTQEYDNLKTRKQIRKQELQTQEFVKSLRKQKTEDNQLYHRNCRELGI